MVVSPARNAASLAWSTLEVASSSRISRGCHTHARARPTHQRNLFAGGDQEVNMAQDGPAGEIAERDVLHLDERMPDRRDRARGGHLVSRQSQHLEDAFGARKRRLDRLPLVTQVG